MWLYLNICEKMREIIGTERFASFGVYESGFIGRRPNRNDVCIWYKHRQICSGLFAIYKYVHLYVVHGVLLTTSERRVKKFANAHVNQNKYKLSQSAAVWWYLYDWEANAVYNSVIFRLLSHTLFSAPYLSLYWYRKYNKNSVDWPKVSVKISRQYQSPHK